MIVLDSSALIAILEREIDAARFAMSIAAAARIFMSAVNVHETGVVLRVRRGPEGVDQMWRFLDGNGVKIVPFDVEQTRAAGSVSVCNPRGLTPLSADAHLV